MSEPPNEGERLELARARRKLLLFAGLAGVGFAVGVSMGGNGAESLFDASTDWPPALAIGPSIVWLLAVVVGGILAKRASDEVELQNHYKAMAAGAAVYFVVYPIWFLLWKGGMVPEPIHAILFLTLWISSALASIYYRYR